MTFTATPSHRAPLLLSEGASHGGGPSQKLAAALVRPAAIPSEGLEGCCGDDRWQVGQALIRARRLIRLNRRTVIGGHGAA